MLGCEWSIAQSVEQNTPIQNAKICVTTDFESARDAHLQPTWSWIIDEAQISDTNHIQYCSEAIMKCLFSPTTNTQIRARAPGNVRIPANVCRILTTNASSPEQWVSTRFQWSAPLARKSIVFVIREPLVVAGWSSHPEYEQSSNPVVDRATPFPAEAMQRTARQPTDLFNGCVAF